MDMKCQNCGSENLDRHIYCDRCGAVIVRPFRIDESAIRGPKEEIARAVEARDRADAVIPLTLIWVYILLNVLVFVASLIISIASATGAISSSSSTLSNWSTTIGSIATMVILLYLYYKLVKRQNDHYARERSLRSAIVSLVRAASDTPEKKQMVEYDLRVMDSLNFVVERHRRPWFWVLVTVLPLIVVPISVFVIFADINSSSIFVVSVLAIIAVGLIALTSLFLQIYMFWFLGETMSKHDGRWGTFSMTARNALSKLGFPAGRPFRIQRLPERSFALYLVLTIFTGIFVFYWLYALLKDPNEHFKYQWEFEDNLMSALGVQRLPTLKDTTWMP